MTTFVETWTAFVDSINSIEVSTVSSIYKLLLSLLLGSIVGYERKRKGQPVGVRTFALIAMGSTLAMILSIYVPQEYMGLKNGDPGRIAAQVVTGIGFLGAGAIIQMKGSVRGLTTAAGIWIVAAIGMAVGVGMYIIATVATLLVIIVLVLVDRYEHKRKLGKEVCRLKMTINSIVDDVDDYRKLLLGHRIRITGFDIEYDFEAALTHLSFTLLVPESASIVQLTKELHSMNGLQKISFQKQS